MTAGRERVSCSTLTAALPRPGRRAPRRRMRRSGPPGTRLRMRRRDGGHARRIRGLQTGCQRRAAAGPMTRPAADSRRRLRPTVARGGGMIRANAAQSWYPASLRAPVSSARRARCTGHVAGREATIRAAGAARSIPRARPLPASPTSPMWAGWALGSEHVPLRLAPRRISRLAAAGPGRRRRCPE